ncbi:SDR family oxidoreductase [Cellulosimicrobium sp. Marseille-Q8652]
MSLVQSARLEDNPYPLRSRTAVVTGAAGGIGQAVARALLGAGANVASLDTRESVLRTDRTVAPPGSRALGVVADVTDAQALRRAREEVHRSLGRVDLVVANAGVMYGGPFERSSEEQWASMVDVNIVGSLNTARAFVDDLLEAAAEERPTDLVFVGSVASHILLPDFSVYSATAAARAHLSRTLRAELSGRGVRVRHVEPGTTLSALGSEIDDDAARERLDRLRSVNQPLTPEDVAHSVLFAASLPAHVNVAELVVMPTHQV